MIFLIEWFGRLLLLNARKVIRSEDGGDGQCARAVAAPLWHSSVLMG
jgi:hypothetical protein